MTWQQEEDDFQNAEEELELDQSSELYKTIVAAIIKEEEDGDSDEEDGENGKYVWIFDDDSRIFIRSLAYIFSFNQVGVLMLKMYILIVDNHKI